MGKKKGARADTPLLRNAVQGENGLSRPRLRDSFIFRQVSCTINDRDILSKISGIAKAGELVAILGPSGGGKTSLLDCLAGRKTVGTISGNVFVGERAIDSTFKSRSGYVTQDMVLLPTLTVKETLLYAARLHLPASISYVRKCAIVEQVIHQLRLTKVRDSQIGDGHRRGLSGGERRRVCIGIELVRDPQFLLLDEPTSGLDSAAALSVIKGLLNLALEGRTIITTIHQPRSSIFELFHKIIVLSEGRLVYQGPPSDVASYFASLGMPCPVGWNIADHVLDILPSESNETPEMDDDDVLEGGTSARALQLTSAGLADTFLESPAGAAMLKDSSQVVHLDNDYPGNIDGIRRTKVRFTNSFFSQFFVLVQRNVVNLSRHPGLLMQSVFGYIVSGLFIGLLFHNLRDLNRLPQLTLGLAFCLDVFGVLAFFNIPTHIKTRANFNRETASGLYSPASYMLAQVVLDIPLNMVVSTIFTALIYWLMRLRGRFLYLLLPNYLALQAMVAINQLMGAACTTLESAIGLGGLFNVWNMMYSGVMINYPNIPKWLIWMYWSSPLTYGQSAILLEEMPRYPGGQAYLDAFGIQVTDYWTCIGGTAGFAVAYLIACYTALRIGHKEKR